MCACIYILIDKVSKSCLHTIARPTHKLAFPCKLSSDFYGLMYTS